MMKKFTQFFSAFVFFGLIFLTNSGYGQLSGSYTIGSTGNYSTFSAAVSALYSSGVSGAVTFTVQSGTYNERAYFTGAISGASATNTITFDGVSRSSVTLQYSGTTSATVRLYMADYVTFKNMTIKHTSTSYATAVSFRNYADYNTISNCHLEVPNSSSTNIKVVMFSNHDYLYSYGSNYHGSYNLIEDCTIKGGYMGVSIYGTSYNTSTYNHHNSFIGNEFTNQYYYAIRFYYGVGYATIQNNLIHNFTYASGYAIYLYRCNNTTIDANIIKPGQMGVYAYYENYYASGNSYFTNNMISDFQYANYNRGLYLYYCRYLNVYHNNIHAGGSTSTYSNAAIYLYSSSSSTYYGNHKIKNNILSVYNGTFAITLYYPYGCEVDYNDYYYPGGGNKFCINGTYYTNLTSFKNRTTYIGTHDQNSWDNRNPYFASSTDLHIEPPTSQIMYAPAITAQNLGFDVDGDTRPTSGNVIIGADQVPPVDLDVTDFTPVVAKLGNNTISMTLKNKGLNPITPQTFSVHYKIDNNSWVTESLVVSSNWDLGVAKIFNFSTQWNITVDASYNVCVKVDPQLSSDPDASDEICRTVAVGMSGTYTIGVGNYDYQTFSAAVSDLYSKGVADSVIFSVQPGTYNERLNLSNSINGASATSPIIFDGGNRTSVTLQYSGTTSATVRFNQADYVTVKNMTIKHNSTSIATAVSFRNNADHNTISNCHLEVPTSSGSNIKVVMFSNHDYYYSYGSNTHGSYNLIEDCTIKGGYFGVTMYGSSNNGSYNHHNSFIGNEFTNQYYYPVYLYNGIGFTTIQNNTIHNLGSTSGYGMRLYYCNNTTIDANIIKPGYYGVYMYYENYFAPGTTYITNNMISDFKYPTYNRGLYLYYCRYLNVLHNTIHAGGTSTSYTNAAIYMYSSSSSSYYSNSIIKNNILSVYNRSFAISLYYPYGCQVDYNNYIYTGTGNKFFLNNYFSNFNSFKNYTGYLGTHDQNSTDNVDPNFISATNLHIQSAVLQAPVVLPSSPDLQHDIDGEIRPSTGTNWIGADKPPPMVYSSVTSMQDTTTGVIGTYLSKVMKVKINTTGLADPKPVTTLTFTTNGSDNVADIVSARLFNKDGNPLETANQVGSTLNNPSGTFTFNLTSVTIPLDGFYLAYDISTTATLGDTLDCTFVSATIDDTLRYPIVTSPNGYQTITNHGTAEQPDTTVVFTSQNLARILNVKISAGAGGSLNYFPITKLYFSTNGSTNALADIKNVRLYRTTNTTPFNLNDTIGTPIMNPNGNFSFNLNYTPNSITTDFWLSYDIDPYATNSDVIDATCDSVVINAYTYTMGTPSPVGNRELVHPASYNNYCDVTRTNAGNYTIGTKRIKFESIDNSTQTLAAGIPPTNTAVQFYPSPVPTVYKQVTYPIMVKHGELNPQGFRLYVDWNNNGYFDGNETVLSYLNNPEGTVINSSFTIPCSATPGWHRMRITSNYGTSIPPACGITAYGEVEDYLIYVPEEDTPVVSFTSDSVGYVGGTTKFTSVSNMDGNIIYRWDYDNDGIYDDTAKIGTHIFNSTGTANVKLQAILVGCTDTFYSTPYIGSIIIRSPTTPPVVNFISNLNTVTTSIPVQFTDLSGMGPFSWKWGISPDTINGNSTFTFVQADTFQNPTIFFNELGEFNIQLTATNVVGSDSTIKYKYIVVVKDQIMCTDDYTEQPSGYLYDDGGKNANYSNPSSGQERTCGFTIYPKCATSIKLDFLDFDVCSYTISTCATLPSDNIKIYDGVDNTGTPLHLQSLNMLGQPNYPDGYKNGGGNVYIGLPPSVTATSGSMYIEFYVNCLAGGTGFEAKWSTQTYTPDDPVANFNMPDTIFTGKTVYFENISTGEYLDYAWDLDGNGWTENTDSMPSRTYDVTGTFNIKLIVYSCGNLSDTMIKPLVVIDPPLRPTVDFTVNFNKLTQRDMVIFTDLSDNSVLSWEWSFTPNTVTYYDGTNSNSPDIHVKFNDNGYYSVKLQAWNSRGDSFELKNNYVWVYSYCNPGVGSLNADVGMSEVILQNSLGDTLIIQSSTIGEAGYTDYSANQIAELAMGGTYIITMKRNSTFNNISRSAWIDYAKDGDFDDPMELLFSQQNSPTISLTDSFTIPFTVPLGLTRLRLGTNLGILGNKGCGPNYSGEFEDYGVVITEDNTKPVIYLYDYDSIMIEYGDTLIFAKCAVFTLPPYIAMDDVNGNITNNVVPGGTVNTSLTGTTMLTFDVSDVAGNAADQAYIYVTILPNTKPPKITLDGNNPDSVAVFGSWSEPGFTDSAFCGIVIWDTTFGTVNTLKPGVYIITYMAMDDDSNTSTAYRDVVVYDLVDPTIVLQGDNPFYIEVNTSFNDPGVTIYDNVNQNISPDITGFVDTSKIGTYFLRYCVTDSSDNGPICVDRTVITYDSTAPVLTVIGPDTICIDVFHNFNDPGYTVYDNYWATNNIKVTITENINTYQLGYYDVTYVAKDGSGNESAPLKRVVCIEDNEAPTIKLNGAGIITVLQWNDFEDPGVTSIDNYYDESNIIISYNENGTWDSSSKHYLGIYTYTYKACDPSDNCSDEITRLLYVEENVGITTNLVVDGNISFYPNPAKNELNIDIELPDHNNVKIGLYNTLGEKVLNVFEGNMQEEHFNVNIDNLSSGVYYIRFIIGDSQYLNKKFIIAK